VASIEPIAVLVVDESETFLTGTLQWIDSRSDLRLVGTARNGLDALDAVERQSPDLVIVEAVLPGIDGFRLARMLKALSDPPLVILVTFHASATARDEAFAAGADGFLAKGDFNDEIELILEAWKTERPGSRGRVKTPAIPARRESRTVPDP
jgi:two-component system, NarL family, nitrate/nitrite response regulator NarL